MESLAILFYQDTEQYVKYEVSKKLLVVVAYRK